MKRTVCFNLVLSVFLLTNTLLFAQESTKNNFTGSWRSNGSWADASFPSNTAGISGGNFNIYGYITLGTSGARQNLTVSNNTDAFDFIVRDTLVIFGDVSFPNNGMDLVISSNALLIVFGDFDLANQMDVSSTGSIIVTGSFTKSGAANQGSYSGGGNVYAGSFNVPGTWVPVADQKNTGADLQSDLLNVYNFVQGGGSGSLPVELTTFEAIVSNEIVTLNWSTASQLNFSHFEIEHSINAKDWTMLAIREGAGTTHERLAYDFTHNLPHHGKNYYRLRMVDLDETVEYSEIITANAGANRAVVLFPNPSNGCTVRYQLNFTPEEGDYLLVYDLAGGMVATQNARSFTGELMLPATLTRGTYLVRYKGRAVDQVTRLVVE